MEDKEVRSVEDVLREKGVYVSTTSGHSMRPLFADRRDTVIISPVSGRLKKYDVPLYRRGDQYILHRIIKVKSDSYVICGDNCVTKEYGITDDQIVGVLTAFYRKDRYTEVSNFRYRIYAFVWCHTYYPRVFLKKVYWLIKRKK